MGREIQKQTQWDFISRKQNGLDFAFLDQWSDLLYLYDTIVNTIAYTDTYSKDSEKHLAINFKAVSNLLDYCVIHKKKIIHISTDYVYANCGFAATETDVPQIQPTFYTYSKLLADAYIQLKGDQYLIIRCSHKPKPFPYAQAWKNVRGNFDYVDVIARLIIHLIQHDADGLYNVGTPMKTMYELAKQTRPGVEGIEVANPLTPRSVEMDLGKLNYFLATHPLDSEKL